MTSDSDGTEREKQDEDPLQITLFGSSSHHLQTLKPIGEAAKSRGHEVTISEDMTASAEVGIYSQHTHFIPAVNADLSVIMFHGLDMGYSERWPGENWSRFDIGLLPGKVATETWKKCAHHPHAHPQVGVFTVGWPKSDSLFSQDFEQDVEAYRQNLGIDGEQIVLYAPTKECDGKLYEFVEEISGVADVLLVKHAPYEYESELQSLYANLPNRENIRVLDRDDPIMHALSLADVVVSDESSVLQEAALTDTIPISVLDWPLRSSKSTRSNKEVPEFAIRTESTQLSDTVSEIFSEYDTSLETLREQRSSLYPNIGSSSSVTVDLIEAIAKDEILPQEPLSSPQEENLRQQPRTVRSMIAKPYHRARYEFVSRLSERNEKRLKEIKLDKLLNKVDDLVGYRKHQ